MCLLHLVASLPTNAERLHERTKKTTNWNSLLRHSSYDKDNKKRKKKDPQINSVSPLKREKIWNFFFPARFVHKSTKRGGSPGRRGGLSAVGPAYGARQARGKRDLETNTLTIRSSVRDERRYDWSEDEKQIEPIIIQKTHRFLCTRRTKIRSNRRRETDGTYHHQDNT